MSVQTPIIGTTTVPGLLAIVANNANQQLTDEAILYSLQQALARQLSPPGSYSPPGSAGYQTYSAKTTAWTSGTSTGNRITTGASSAANAALFYTDVWDPANSIDIFIGQSASNIFAVYRCQRYSNKVSTVVYGQTLSGLTNAGTLISCTIVSATVARIVWLQSGTVYDVLATWNGTTLALSQNSTPGNFVGGLNKRGFLCGSASIGLLGGPPTVSGQNNCQAVIVKDRAGSTMNDFRMGSQIGVGGAVASQTHDVVGNGYILRGGQTVVAGDGTPRPAVFLEYYDDNNAMRAATLRIPNTSYLSWYSLTMVSPTLAIGVFADAASALYTCAIAVNVGSATPLSLYGPFTAGNLQKALAYPMFYSATCLYLVNLSLTSGANVVVSKLTFDPTQVGNELVSNVSDNFTIVLGKSGAGSGGTGAVITGISAISAVQTGADTLSVVYSGTRTSDSALYNWQECFVLS